jgi:hypothetical protein
MGLPPEFTAKTAEDAEKEIAEWKTVWKRTPTEK